MGLGGASMAGGMVKWVHFTPEGGVQVVNFQETTVGAGKRSVCRVQLFSSRVPGEPDPH